MDYTPKFNFGKTEDEQTSDKYDEQRQEQDNTHYPTAGHIRNICFVQEDGNWTFLSYNYLVSADYKINEDALYLVFTSHTVILQGKNLTLLRSELMAQIPRIIVCSNPRYNLLEDNKKGFAVNTIQVNPN